MHCNHVYDDNQIGQMGLSTSLYMLEESIQKTCIVLVGQKPPRRAVGHPEFAP